MGWESKRQKALQRQGDRRMILIGMIILAASAWYFGAVKVRFPLCENATPDGKLVATISLVQPGSFR
ncbi:hypothetical protein [Geomesophilobacter sediminis]|uniref:Uncharacterized protein n=1 Tax=Geomesophilobacter sediminis TaxID=2798584 RepID=A0A8J7M2E6_9BACT|nr:hypothetical protein [Geomesophilobacter sediminis]MBJ6727363.1 hypothetical protein [Geomesophilobacter sediminis]